MQNNNARRDILNRIADTKSRLFVHTETAEYNDEIYKPIEPDPVTCFKTELEQVNGKCFICDSMEDAVSQIAEQCRATGLSKIHCLDPQLASLLQGANLHTSSSEADFTNMEAGITGCEYLVARTGSVMISSASLSGRKMIAFPPIHIIIADISQMTDYPSAAAKQIQEKYKSQLPSLISFITGPSRTADIEKTLVLGAHGPKELWVFLNKG